MGSGAPEELFLPIKRGVALFPTPHACWMRCMYPKLHYHRAYLHPVNKSASPATMVLITDYYRSPPLYKVVHVARPTFIWLSCQWLTDEKKNLSATFFLRVCRFTLYWCGGVSLCPYCFYWSSQSACQIGVSLSRCIK
jgi:hypothetical protein